MLSFLSSQFILSTNFKQILEFCYGPESSDTIRTFDKKKLKVVKDEFQVIRELNLWQ